MATITAHRAAEMLARPPVVYTFGQPRTSNAAFARLLDHSLPRYFRVTNGGDPVPDVPGCTYSSNGTCMATPTGYHHAGTEIWFPKGDYQNGVMCGYRECTGEPKAEDYACGQASSFGSVYDHCGYFNLIPDGFCNKLGGSPALLPPLAVGGAAETVVV
ncbi:unnamed protein product [Prorocentrum cordatum]|uniref:Fungal lipase-type domain-containing protein n=1 Tax=Prorocentrum cordatum TaxID=2364126 RepID=A0ABN9SNH4_9DINO|nr:unnamed protein product [Polarella glacialis]